MTVFDLFWIFFIIATLQPLVRQRMLEAARVRLIHEIERRRKSRVIALIHRQETMSILGFPVFRYIDIDDSENVLRAIKLTDPELPIDLILHTPGGLVLAAEQIAFALKRRPGKVTVFVPHYAMSGGTLIALAADEIVMDPNAVLGPLDPQIGQFPAASILKVLEIKQPKDIDDQTLILADMSRKAINQVAAVVRDLLLERMEPAEAERVANLLTSGTWTHDYPITVEQARELGLPVSTDMPPEIYQLMRLFPQAQQARPSVTYIPAPYRTVPQPAGRQAGAQSTSASEAKRRKASHWLAVRAAARRAALTLANASSRGSPSATSRAVAKHGLRPSPPWQWTRTERPRAHCSRTQAIPLRSWVRDGASPSGTPRWRKSISCLRRRSGSSAASARRSTTAPTPWALSKSTWLGLKAAPTASRPSTQSMSRWELGL
jgi:ClpP class serine protease